MTQGPPTPPTPEELWEEVIQEAGEAEIEAACAESDAEVEAYLTANGFDVAAERAKGEAFLAMLEGKTDESDAVRAESDAVQASDAPDSERDAAWEAPGRRLAPDERMHPAAGWIATAATVALGAAATASVLMATPAQPDHGGSDVHATRRLAPAEADALELRDRAKVALDAWSSEDCLRLLDQAKAKDPHGDDADDVVEMRKTAEERLVVGDKPKR